LLPWVSVKEGKALFTFKQEEDDNMQSPPRSPQFAPRRKETSKMVSMFSSKKRFKNAVKIVSQKSLMYRRTSIEFTKILNINKIVTQFHLKEIEQKLIFSHKTGYSLSVDIEDPFMHLPALSQLSPPIPKETLLSEVTMVTPLVLKRVFTFSKADYSWVYNDVEEHENDSVISRLLSLTQFANVKMREKLENFQTRHMPEIMQLTDEKLQNELDKGEEKYAARRFMNESLQFIVGNKRASDSVYHITVDKHVILEFSGIVLSLDKEVFETVFNSYMCTYCRFRKKFIFKRRNRVPRIIKHINRDYLPLIYNNHRIFYTKLFERTWDSEIKKIVFNDYSGNETPRIIDDQNYEVIIQSRIKQMISNEFFKNNLTVDEQDYEKKWKRKVSIRHTVSRRMSSVCLSEHIDEFKHSDVISRIFSNKKSQLPSNENLGLWRKSEEDAEIWLSDLYGYKWVNVKLEGGIYEVFEPVLTRKYEMVSKITKKNNFESKSESDFTDFEESEEEKFHQPNKLLMRKDSSEKPIDSQNSRVYLMIPLGEEPPKEDSFLKHAQTIDPSK
jgi:hypothetical protein